MEDLDKKLENEIEVRLEELGNLELGTGEYSRAANDVLKLYRTRMEEVKNNAEYWDRIEARDKQAAALLEAKESEAKEQRTDRWIRYGLEVLGMSLPLIVYTGLFKTGLRFEKDGVVGSTFFRNLIGKAKI